MDDGLHSKVPNPDSILGQHAVPLPGGQIAVKADEVLVAADSVNVRIIGEPCKGTLNPQLSVDPIPLSMRIISGLQDHIDEFLGEDSHVTVACWGFHAGIPGNDYVAFANFLLDANTIDSERLTRACEDFTIRGSADTDGEVATNHSPFCAPDIEPTLQTGVDAMALAVLSFRAISDGMCLVGNSQNDTDGELLN
ncbi:hypothetical protein P280DRAFT_505904 [Massarina eburnea CBS 473.64]|uniref:Uncharacterized protein n=1 Tax=Massarina eburnea CBS 473.64 TaxID=1395130 RepID=A0A6A6S7W6_9PLEO|nr:hypothetical protein P280DRAFT_505904 [Massarina eburnea CBS 473.64]